MTSEWSMSSFLTLYVLLVFELVTARYGVETLSEIPVNVAVTPNDCFTRCNRRRSQQLRLDCMKGCLLVQKRSVHDGDIWPNVEECDYDSPDVWVTTGNKPRGIAKVCVEYKLDNAGGYESANVSWMLPQDTNLKNDSTKYADVKGFFLRWRLENELNDDCRPFPKNVTYFVLNSTRLRPSTKMKCNIQLLLVVKILPLSPNGEAGLRPYNCSGSPRTRECFHWDYKTVAPTYQTVGTSESTSSSPPPPSTSPPPSATSIQAAGIKKDRDDETDIACDTSCQYAVYISVAAVVVFVVVLMIFLVKTKRITLCNGSPKPPIIRSKDYIYVSYFYESGKSSGASNTVLGLLKRCSLRIVAVNYLYDQTDQCNYYELGPRKFSELYMQNARYVIVLVTKKYLQLCDVNNNAELGGETRRVFEEIRYIDRAQLEPPAAVISLPEKNGNILPAGQDDTSVFANNYTKDKRFIAVVLESGLKLPTWMKGWPVYRWPKDEAALQQLFNLSVS